MHILHTLNFTFMYIHIFIQFNHYAWLNFELYFLKNMSIYFWELVYTREMENECAVSARMKQGVRKWRSKKMNVDALSLSLTRVRASVQTCERENECVHKWMRKRTCMKVVERTRIGSNNSVINVCLLISWNQRCDIVISCESCDNENAAWPMYTLVFCSIKYHF